MNTLTRNTALALIASLTLVMAGTAAAAPPMVRLVAPPAPILPEFGFSSFNIAGYGERVTMVRWGGLAAQLGLEPGDTILRLNGYPLTYQGAWDNALARATADGWLRLTIRDVRTGAIAVRQMALSTPVYGPYAPYGPITPKIYVDVHGNHAGPGGHGPGGHGPGGHGPDAHQPPHGGPGPLIWGMAKLLDKN